MATAAGRMPQRIKKAAVVLFGLLIGCAAAEIGLRIAGYSYPLFYQPDPVRGYGGIPKNEGWSWPENKVYVTYNSEGFRDGEHTVEKPSGTIRVAVIGDSFTEGRQVPLEATYWKVAEKLMAQEQGKPVEFLNFGVTGYGTANELLTLRDRVWKYSPDVIVLGFCVYNDVTDNLAKFKGASETPYFRLDGDRLVLDDGFLRSKKYLRHDSVWFRAWTCIHNHSRLIQLLHHAQFALRTKIQTIKEERKRAAAQPPGESSKKLPAHLSNAQLVDIVGLPNVLYREPDDIDWTTAWNVTDALVTQINAEVREHGSKFVLMTVTSDVQVAPDRGVREAMTEKLGVDDLYYPNRRLQMLAESLGFQFIDVGPPMQSAAEKDGTFFHGFPADPGTGHWNEVGHEFAGKMLAAKLRELIGTD